MRTSAKTSGRWGRALHRWATGRISTRLPDVKNGALAIYRSARIPMSLVMRGEFSPELITPLITELFDRVDDFSTAMKITPGRATVTQISLPALLIDILASAQGLSFELALPITSPSFDPLRITGRACI